MSDMNNPLPPELVEKMKSEIRNGILLQKTIGNIANPCAQIAVDYADEANSDTFISLYKSQEALGQEVKRNQLLKQQRDELIECLSKLFKHYEPATRSEIELFNKTEQLIKNHEDGKG